MNQPQAGPSSPRIQSASISRAPVTDPNPNEEVSATLADLNLRQDGLKEDNDAKDDKKGKTKVKPRSRPIPKPIEAFSNPATGEEEMVHEVYERIAPHFSQTRFKPWPLITTFLNSLPPGSIGLDSGAGNGKYIPTASDAGHSMIALDRSLGLLEIAQKQRGAGDVIRGDLGARCWRSGVYDFVISVAAIHHLSTPERRRQSVQALLPCLRHSEKGPYARFFIYVWAYEQGSLSKRAMGSAATPAPNPDPDPTLISDNHDSATVPISASTMSISNPTPVTSTNEPASTSVSESKASGERIQDVLVPWVLKAQPNEGKAEEVHHRYYHLFVRGELKEMVLEAGKHEGYRIITHSPDNTDTQATETGEEGLGRWLRIRGEGWEADNWWIEAEVGQGPYRPETES